MGFFSKIFAQEQPGKDVVDLAALSPPFDASYRMGGRFQFYGTLDEGSPQYDLPPPAGVVRVQYKYEDRTDKNMAHVNADEKGRVGFFKCSRSEFSDLKRAWANWNHHTSWGDYDAEGTYPNVQTLVVPYGKRAA